jgi:hypothetical protein
MYEWNSGVFFFFFFIFFISFYMDLEGQHGRDKDRLCILRYQAIILTLCDCENTEIESIFILILFNIMFFFYFGCFSYFTTHFFPLFFFFFFSHPPISIDAQWMYVVKLLRENNRFHVNTSPGKKVLFVLTINNDWYGILVLFTFFFSTCCSFQLVFIHWEGM